MSFEREGSHWQPLETIVKPSQLLYLRHVAQPEIRIVDYLLHVLSISKITDVLYLRDVCAAVGKIFKSVHKDAIPLRWKKETLLMHKSQEYMRDLAPLLYHLADNPHDAAYLLYHLSIKDLLLVPFASPRPCAPHFDCLAEYLTKYSDECTLNITQDLYLHTITAMHLPAEIVNGELTPFRLLTNIMADYTNKLIRPYINNPLVDQIKSRAFDSDDVVLFTLFVTLIVEIERKAHLTVKYNRDILSIIAPHNPPTPFVLIDMDLGQGTDCYGYTYQGAMVVCNGLGVSKALSQWIEVCNELQYCREVTSGNRINPTNPLYKFTL